MRQIVLDTETTGLEPELGHRIIEIGCVELRGRRLTGKDFHHYLNPDREIDAGAIEVHGITNEMLLGKPYFANLAEQLIEYLRGAELLIHNAAFDVGFLDKELEWAGRPERIADICTVTDTLAMARDLYPGQRNSLDALCKRLDVDNSSRDLHGALLDAQILADVYLMMTGGQGDLMLAEEGDSSNGRRRPPSLDALIERAQGLPLTVVPASEPAMQAHQERLSEIERKAGRLFWPAGRALN